MALTSYKVLGQSNPVANTYTTLYTAPTSTSAIISTLSVVSIGTSSTFRVAVRPAGATLANQHYIIYDAASNQYDSIFLTLGITLGSTDVVTVYSSTANTSFSLFGSEIS